MVAIQLSKQVQISLKSLLIAAFCLVGGVRSVCAQTLMVEKAFELLKKKELDKSWEAIQLATKNEETAQDARAWYVRSYVSKELFKADPQKNAKFGVEALDAGQTSMRLDQQEKYHKECKAIASFVYTNYYNQTVTLLNSESYQDALTRLKALTKDRRSFNEFYAEASYLSGYAYLMLHQPDSTQHYFSQALTAGYRDPLIYETLASTYLDDNEVGKARTMVDMGQILFTDDRGLKIAELNTLMKEKHYERAAKAAEEYLSSYKKDTEVMLLYGTIQGRMLDNDPKNQEAYFEKRIAIYEKILKLEPNNLLANYNLGITYYNKGVELINNEEVFEKDIFEFDQLLNVCAGLFQKALPFVLKANQLDPSNFNALKALEGIYYNLNEQEKYAQVQARINAISSK
ncbi:MAG: hypothetical protein WA960_08150 [Tunicatimonas sp.]